MQPTATALRAGLARGLIELRQSFTGAGLLGHLFWPVVTLVAIFFLRARSFGASGFTLGTLAILLLPGLLIVHGLAVTRSAPGSPWPGCWDWAGGDPGHRGRAGALTASPAAPATCRCRSGPDRRRRHLRPARRPPGLAAADRPRVPDGPAWPGHGLGPVAGRGGRRRARRVLAALETVAVLGAWVVLGLIVAPIVLRRMARRESGSTVAKRREKLLQRIR